MPESTSAAAPLWASRLAEFPRPSRHGAHFVVASALERAGDAGERSRQALPDGPSGEVAEERLARRAEQDGTPLGREGFQARVGIVAAGPVDAVVVPALETFSPAKVLQEVVVWALRRRDISVLSTAEDELPLL